MDRHLLYFLAFFATALAPARAMGDDMVYGYEGAALPYPTAGWLWGGCDGPCSESVEDGHFVLHWANAGNQVTYTYVLSNDAGQPPQPPTLWVEWGFRSNQLLGSNYTCDGAFALRYRRVYEVVFMFGDAAVSFSGDVVRRGLASDNFTTYRFESTDGIRYRLFVNGTLFLAAAGGKPSAGAFLQMDGGGGCDPLHRPAVNFWDFVRFGTISYGEKIVASDPPQGFVDPRTHAPLDRFTVTYDSPNYVYIHEITVDVTAGVAPAVIATRRLDNGPPDVVEIVLDRPIPYNATTRFIFNDGVAVSTVEYTFAPGDTDGDGDADLADFAAFQNCFDVSPISGACQVSDFNADGSVDLLDFAAFQTALAAP